MLQLILPPTENVLPGNKEGEQMKRIVLLRHGESTWNKDNRLQDGQM